MEPFAEGQPERIDRRGVDRACTIPDQVRRLVEKLDTLQDSRSARVSRARRLLLTGRLDSPGVFRETARRMLELG